MDSLNSCCLLGQTTSFNSSKVACKNPPFFSGCSGPDDVGVVAAVVSSDVGLVTDDGSKKSSGPVLTPALRARDSN